MDVYLNGKKLPLDPKRAIGKGGEADVFNIGRGQAVKVFKQPDHPDYQGCPTEQQAAQLRLSEHQQKLRHFPSNLPNRVIQPQALVSDRSGQTILGYTMPLIQGADVLLRYGEPSFRQAGISSQMVTEIFRDLHTSVSKLHHAGVVIGDFNDLNILIRGTEAYLIDADSFQYGSFLCKVFTTRFVDPLLCDPTATKPMLQQPHSAHSDWYAFTVMLMHCLLFVDPYGGVYRPKDPAQRLAHDARPLHRITVFHPEVRYPKPARPYDILPDDLLHYFHQVFEQDQRGEFPRSLVEQLQWTLCPTCGTEHTRSACPHCIKTKGITQTVTVVRGTVTATRVFKTPGVVLYATVEAGQLHWLYYEQGTLKREDGSTLFKGDLDPQIQFRLRGKQTLIGKEGQVIILAPGEAPTRLAIDTCGLLPMFDVNESACYWADQGQLLHDGQLGPQYIGDILAGQTRFWVGSQFGFGFYRAGNLNIAFVFDAHRRGLNDQVKLPASPGQLVDATCVFSQDLCWFFSATQEQGKILHRCTVIRPNGTVIATAQAEKGDGSWLSRLSGKCAASTFLLAATDDGIVRVQPENGQIVKVKEFPDTEPFVNDGCQLFAGQQGLYVVSPQEIQMLKIQTN